MCDYSLEMYGSRPAREGETYVTTRFPSGSIGFAAPGAPNIAVCMQCDTDLALSGIPDDLRARLGVGAETTATFAQTDVGTYRDGVRLPNGRFVLLQDLRPGVRAHIPALLENQNRAAARSVRTLEEVE
jgi:hypothetical protein